MTQPVETVILRTRRGWFYRVPKNDLLDKEIAREWIKKIAEVAGVKVSVADEEEARR
ncbi:MAG: hypothetical protein ACE5KO_03265 [Candidatus Bathyarchaeia archaeon]